MHRAEEVRDYANTIAFTEREKEMLLSYAALLEAMDSIVPNGWGSDVVVVLRKQAEEILRRKG